MIERGFPKRVKVCGFVAGGEVGFELVGREVEECYGVLLLPAPSSAQVSAEDGGQSVNVVCVQTISMLEWFWVFEDLTDLGYLS